MSFVQLLNRDQEALTGGGIERMDCGPRYVRGQCKMGVGPSRLLSLTYPISMIGQIIQRIRGTLTSRPETPVVFFSEESKGRGQSHLVAPINRLFGSLG